jgi:LCP family protein required for cell wall assembly
LGGGPNAIVETLKTNFDVDINHYVEVDFETFEGMVNAVGSVPVYVDRPAVDEVTGFLAAKAGCYHLNGPQALAWVRARSLKYLNPVTGRLVEDATADIGRIGRQQDFIRRLLGSVVEESLANPLKGRDIVHDVIEDLRVDRAFDKEAAFDLVQAFRNVSSADTSALEFVTLPATPGVAEGQDVLRANDDAVPIFDRLRTFDTDPDAPAPVVAPSEVRVEVRNGSGIEGLATETMDELAAAGFLKGGTGNDERGRVAVTEVRYASGAQDKARLVLDYVGKSAKLVGDPSLRTADVVVVLGADFDGIEPPGGAAAASTPDSSDPAASPTETDLAAACR